MNYPLISEYVEAIKAAEDNFEQLKHLRPVLDDDGQPVMTGGNFAEVFKMKDEMTGKFHAVKCFLREQEGRAEAYRQIAEELEYVSSTFLTPIKYLDKELFVDTCNSDESEFPVLLMDWVEGQTLDKYIREHIDDEYELSLLAYQFSRLAMWLLPQPFAHGDLKPDNILVKNDGTLVLVDYDGMFVPAMKGQKARELGSPDFRHPSRTEIVFDEHIDDFSLVSILLSLKAIALQPDLLEQYGASDRLLFSEKDYRNLSESQVMDALKTMMQDTELATLYSLFILSSAQNNLSQASFRLLNLKKPQKKIRPSLRRLKITKPIVNIRKELIPYFQGKENVTHVISPDGTETYLTQSRSFADEAYAKGSCKLNTVENDKKHVLFLFNRNDEEVGRYYMGKKLQGKTPAQLTKMKNVLVFFESWNPETKQWVPCVGIADNTTQEVDNLRTNVTEDDLANAWTDEYGVMYSADGSRLLRVVGVSLSSYSVRKGTKVICDEAFSWIISAGYGAYDDCDLTQITIPDSLIVIGERAFSGCNSLIEIILPNSISQIGDCAFYHCESLSSINIPNSLSVIGESVFSECAFSHISIPNTIKKIGNYAFYHCNNLEEVIIPDSVTDLGAGAFGSCSSLKHVTIPDSITELGYEAFSGSALTHIEIPKSITKIGSRAFWNSSLTQIEIPDSVKIIEEGAFYGSCLEQITLPNSISEIADSAFYDCFALKQISIPNSVTRIGDNAFYGCSNLSQIELPDSINYIEGGAFLYCESLIQITIPDSVVELGDIVFSNCHSLKYISFAGIVNKIGDDIFHECEALEQIVIPIGTKGKYDELLPDYKDKLIEKANKETITFDNSNVSIVERCRVYKDSNRWIVKIDFKAGKTVDYPLSLLAGNQDIFLDEQSIKKLEIIGLNLSEGFYINPKAISITHEPPTPYNAKILFDADYLEISGITWGLNNNINQWQIKRVRSFNLEERLAVIRAEVVPSDYGSSVCFFMNAGGKSYIPLFDNSELSNGDELDMNTAKLITLCHKGQKDIVRVLE